MNLKALRLFRLTVLQGTLSGAAASANLSQSSASRMIATLEAELKIKLFERINQRLVLTAEGERFFQEAEHILNGVEEIPKIARDIRAEIDETLRIITVGPIGASLLPPVIDILRDENPGLKCKIDIGTRSDVESQVGSRRYNLGLLSLPVKNNVVELGIEPILEARTQVLLPISHPLAALEIVPAEAFADEPFVSLRANQIWRQRLDRVFESIGKLPNISLEIGSSLLVPKFVESGYGLGVMDMINSAFSDSTKTVLRPIAPEFWLPYACVMPPAGRNRLAMHFVELLRQYVTHRCEDDPVYGQAVRPVQMS
ncbi:MAG TPA: LysR family transcriptional regulator [Thalassospira sp.]|nr:LysR family transcriptional regulator [Thalassospira sp.]